MKKKVIKTTCILLVISALSKLLSFLIRIFIARILSSEAIQYYSLTTPVLVFLMTLSQFGIPSALTQMIASRKKAQDTVAAAIVLSLINNFLLIILCVLGIPLYARLILHQSLLIPVLYACVPLLPMVMLSGLCKGYLIGRQNMILASSSQITEEIVRLLFLWFLYPFFSSNPVLMASFAILSQTAGEIGSCIHLGFALILKQHKRIHIPLHALHMDTIKELLNLSIPMTSARLIGSLTAFLEPIILLGIVVESHKDAYLEIFSQMNTYILPLITLPGFFSLIISSWLLPAFSQAFATNIKRARQLFLASFSFSLVAGCSICGFLFLFAKPVCTLLYHKTDMVSLLKMLALPFSLYAAQPVLGSVLHGANQSTRAMIDTICGCCMRLVSLAVMVQNSFAYAAPVALILSVSVTTLLHLQACSALFINHK